MPHVEDTQQAQEPKKHGAAMFVLAGISFLPVLGVPFGIACIVVALGSRYANSKLLGILGGSGILVTVLLFGVVFPSLMSQLDDPKFYKTFEPQAKSAMTLLVRTIEYYKLQNSRYPTSLEELRESWSEGEMVVTFDFSAPTNADEEQPEFYYEVVRDGQNYLLFGVGQDREPFTEDDIFPLIDPDKDKTIGWVKAP